MSRCRRTATPTRWPRHPGHLRPGAEHDPPRPGARLRRDGRRVRHLHRGQRARLLRLSRLPAGVPRSAFETLANLATKAGVEGAGRFRVHSPLLKLTKAEIIREGVRLGVDYSLTLSCYDPDAEGRACGRCDSCQLRKKGFAEAGVARPDARTRNRPPNLIHYRPSVRAGLDAMIDLSVSLGRLKLRNPDPRRVRHVRLCEGDGRARRLREARRHHPQDGDAARRAPATRRREPSRPPAACSTPSASTTTASNTSSPTTCRTCARCRPRSSATSPARPRTSSSRWRRAFTQAGQGLAALELNLSCPNVVRRARLRHRPGGDAPHRAALPRRLPRLPLIAKLTPNVTDITPIAQGRGRRRRGRGQRGEHLRRAWRSTGGGAGRSSAT